MPDWDEIWELINHDWETLPPDVKGLVVPKPIPTSAIAPSSPLPTPPIILESSPLLVTAKMNTVLQVGDWEVTPTEIIPLLHKYQLLPQLLREMIIDRATVAIEYTDPELTSAYQKFYQQQKLVTETDVRTWLDRQNMDDRQLHTLIISLLKLEKFKQQTWGDKIPDYFSQRKDEMDQVVYSLLRTQDAGIAQELYFRLQDGESSFSDLAREYSEGIEAKTGGLMGPVLINNPHPAIAQMLRRSTPGQLWPPTHVENWFVLLKLEKFIPAQLDEITYRQLLEECFEEWLQGELKTALGNNQHWLER